MNDHDKRLARASHKHECCIANSRRGCPASSDAECAYYFLTEVGLAVVRGYVATPDLEAAYALGGIAGLYRALPPQTRKG